MDYVIEVIGDFDIAVGFALAGVNRLIEKKGKELAKYIEETIKNKEEKIIIIQESYFETLPGKTKVKTLTSIKPLFIVLGKGKSNDLSLMVKRVFGVDLLNKK